MSFNCAQLEESHTQCIRTFDLQNCYAASLKTNILSVVAVFIVVLQQFREICTSELLSNKKKNYFKLVNNIIHKDNFKLINNNIVFYFNGIFLRNRQFQSSSEETWQ